MTEEPAPIDLPVSAGLAGLDGQIVLASQEPPAVVIMQPVTQDGALGWKCSGEPRELMPETCKDAFSPSAMRPLRPKMQAAADLA